MEIFSFDVKIVFKEFQVLIEIHALIAGNSAIIVYTEANRKFMNHWKIL
jgi:hypothetical protein